MNLDAQFARLAAFRPSPRRPGIEPEFVRASQQTDPDQLAELLGASRERNHYGEYLAIRRWFAEPSGCEGAAALCLLVPTKPPLTSAALKEIADPARWLFLDTETTGLAGGTGTYAFLIGLAWWDSGGLQVEQFFMRDYSEEHAVLLAVAERLAERRILVTFNGKSFDWPLLETRYRMTRQITPQTPRAHLDLLHPARQLWKLSLASLRLAELERHVLSWERGSDLPSELIPQIYFDFLRGASVVPLAGVFRHNQMDLRGLAALSARLAALLSVEEIPEAAALELYGLSRLLHRRGEFRRARLLCEQAVKQGLPAIVDRAARSDLARLAKRERDFTRAVALWEGLVQSTAHREGLGRESKARAMRKLRSRTRDSVPGPSLKSARTGADQDPRSLKHVFDAYEQLAIYYEHHARKAAHAADFAQRGIAELKRACRAGYIGTDQHRRWQTRLERRVARLVSKSSPPLF